MNKIKESAQKQKSAVKKSSSKTPKSNPKKSPIKKDGSSILQSKKTAARVPQAAIDEIEELKNRLLEAEETLDAIRSGAVDALVVSAPEGDQVYTLKGAEHTYRVLVEAMNEGALTLTEGGNIIYCNMAFVAMAGISFGKLVDVPFRDLVYEEDKGKFDILWKNALLGTGTEEIELNVKGGRLPVYLSCSTRVQDEVLTVFAIATDITERKKAQEALKKANDELELRVEERTIELSKLNDELKTEIEIRKGAEEEIRRHVEELRLSNEKLVRFNRAAVGRELRMVELKKEINELHVQLGQPPRYKLDFAEEPRRDGT